MLTCQCPQYVDAVDKKVDVDTVEVKVDDIMRSVLQQLYGCTTLEDEVGQHCCGDRGRAVCCCSVHPAFASQPYQHIETSYSVPLSPHMHEPVHPCTRTHHTQLHTPVPFFLFQPLRRELEYLEEAVNQSQGSRGVGDMFSLALNSLQRLHAGQMAVEESEEEEEAAGAEEVEVGGAGQYFHWHALWYKAT